MEKVTTEADLRMYVDGAKKAEAYMVHVPEQELTKQEEQAYLRAAEEELVEEFPGDNESVNCIRDAVVIREEYQEGHVEAEWSFDNYRLIESRTGRIVGEPDEEGELVNVQVTLTCGKSRCVQEFSGILRVSQTVRRGRALPEGDFRKDCATAAGGGSGQTVSAG